MALRREPSLLIALADSFNGPGSNCVREAQAPQERQEDPPCW